MGEANAAYYAAGDPLGAAGDFITAPEISQMFGEMIGLWLTDLWRRAGEPKAHYVELGPGRGTLAADALRVMKPFGLVPHVHFVETSPALRVRQKELVPDARWHDDVESLPSNAPLLLVANEFFDALPVRQLVKTVSGWRERMVTLSEGGFTTAPGAESFDSLVPERLRHAEPGSILETCPAAATAMGAVARQIAHQGGAAIVIDYGYSLHAAGDTLQAVHAHAYADPFAKPGLSDLTAHVDFGVLGEAARAAKARVAGPVEQGAWLEALGIRERAASLTQAAPEHGPAIATALARLTGEEEMGTLFKAMAVLAPSWPEPEGFR